MTLAPDVTALSPRVDSVLAEFVGRERVPHLAPMVEALRGFIFNGGKRLRPSLCYWAWRGSTLSDNDEWVIRAGAALELFHCFALIHDDIIDRSSMRRGRPSLHAAYGNDIALLCGDLCILWSEQLFAECSPPPEARQLFAALRVEAIAGEYLDITAQSTRTLAVEQALEVIRWKTTRYSIVRPLQIGAVMAGADPATVDGYELFGEPLGEAFQLRDDMLGVFGDPALTGKSATDDLTHAKPTVLLALTHQRAGRELEVLLRQGNPDAIRELMVTSGARDETEARIRAAKEAALQVLSELDIAGEARAALAALTELAATRTR